MELSGDGDTKSGAGELAITVRGLCKRFGERVVFDGLDLDVRRGETLALLGSSGVGKSVLLRLIIGLHKPEAGHILVDGQDTVSLSERALRAVRRDLALVFQGGALFDSMSVEENVAYGLYEHFRWSARRMQERVAECLAWVGLSGIERLRPAELSGGMRKRVALARALAPGPRVILYDEPTGGLDPASARRINELIVALQRRLGVTSMVITHDMPSAFAVSDRIGLLANHHVELLVDTAAARLTPPAELRAFVRGETPPDDEPTENPEEPGRG